MSKNYPFPGKVRLFKLRCAYVHRSGDIKSAQLADEKLFELLTNKRNELLELAFERLGSDKYVDKMLAISWLIDFKNLVPDQKLITKKGIQDILYEAELGNLRSDSVAVNEPQRSKVCEVTEERAWHISGEEDVDANFPCVMVCKAQPLAQPHTLILESNEPSI